MPHSLAIILAAGEGTRMKSDLPKVLHRIAGRSMLAHVLAAVTEAGIEKVAVVVAPDRPAVAEEVKRLRHDALIVEQRDRLGTAHAALQARAALEEKPEAAIILFADTPLVTAGTIAALAADARGGAAVAALGFEAADPAGYGRLILEDGALIAIREHKDASEAERRISLCNAGLMALHGEAALSLLEAIGNANAKGEYYLPDAVEIARQRGLATAWREAPEQEVQGVNDRAQLAAAEAVMQQRLRMAHLMAGVTMIDPQTVFLSADTRIARDVLIEPNCWFGPGVSIASGAVIHAFSHLEGAEVGNGASIGPYARLRPGTVVGEKARIGNFVEAKAAHFGPGAKANHLSYIGDATIGAAANIGAGTITCNYDGYEKFRTEIGAGAFIGSNSSLVAPVSIGEGAMTGSGSVITASIPADALGLGRARQEIKPGWAKTFRALKQARKSK
jgi:bifunctional UDP-N-acetylglucosamine pyrophosphorylase / glucosamine-1-phosphate N-acetyltransferase